MSDAPLIIENVQYDVPFEWPSMAHCGGCGIEFTADPLAEPMKLDITYTPQVITDKFAP